MANAPITPSKLKLASRISKYNKLANAAQPVLILTDFASSSWKNDPNSSNPICSTIPRTAEINTKDLCGASTVKYKTAATLSIIHTLKFSNRPIIIKNAPPNASIIGDASCRISPYSTGLWSAILTTSINPWPLAIITIAIGNINRTTNTAMKIPTVKNIFCQTWLIPAKTLLFITALSKLNVTSKTTKIVNSQRPLTPIWLKIKLPKPKVNRTENQKIRNGWCECKRCFILI